MDYEWNENVGGKIVAVREEKFWGEQKIRDLFKNNVEQIKRRTKELKIRHKD